MKKGFTLIELLTVVVILAVIALISVPIYIGISNKIKKSIYESKLENIKIKAEAYASDTNDFVFDVRTLIENGRLEPDNELGEYKDPLENRDMRCDIINVIYSNNAYEAVISKSDTCYSQEELLNMYGMISLKLYKDEAGTEEITKYDDTDWTSDSPVYIKYSFTDKYQDYGKNILNVSWQGENTISCSTNELNKCDTYVVEAETLKNIEVTFSINLLHGNVKFFNKTNVRVMIDKQSPTVLMDTLTYDNNVISNKSKKVEIDVSDNNGSGVKEYSLVNEPNCDNAKYKELNNNRISEYLTNGTYYVCVKDKVGNINSNVLSTKFNVLNVDGEKPNIIGFSESGTTYTNNEYYKSLTINIASDDKDSGVNEIHYCLTTSQNCEPDNIVKVNGSFIGSVVIPDNDNLQNICAIAIDKAGNVSDKKCFGSFWKKENLTINDLNKLCNINNGYCSFDGGIYVKYGNKLFTVYKESNKSMYAYTTANNTIPLINVTCCDSGKCHLSYVYSSIGVSGNLSSTFASLPSTRTTNINQDTYRYGYVTSNSFQNIKNIKVNQNITEHHITEFSLSDLPDVINDGYTYGLPSESLENVYCHIKKSDDEDKSEKYLERLNLTTNGKNFDYKVGSKYIVKCEKISEEEIKSIEKEITIGENPDNNEDDIVSDGTTMVSNKNIKMASNVVIRQERYGLLDIEEYQILRKKTYAKDISTLLSTAVNKVVYSGDNRSYGHDGVYSSISAIYASSTGYVGLTPMSYGKKEALMTVPFNKSVNIKSGIGSMNDPFVIE